MNYRIPSLLYILMILYVILAIIKQMFVPSAIFPFMRMQVMCSFLCFGIVFIMLSDIFLRNYIRMWWKYIPLIFILICPFVHKYHYLNILYFCLFYIIVIEYITKRKCLFIYFAYFMMVWGIFQRMDIIKLTFPFIILLLMKFNLLSNKTVCKIIYHFVMLIPIILFYIGTKGNFNIFGMDKYISEEYITSSGENLKQDTRTLLYTEAISSAIKNDYVLYGRTPAYGYDTPWFLLNKKKHSWYKEAGVYPQRNAEVFVVNIFTWMGLIGLITWFLFFYTLGLKAISKSKNKYINAFALFIGMFWVGCWIEYPFDFPTIEFITLYLVSALCLRKELCLLDNNNMKIYLKKILNGQ